MKNTDTAVMSDFAEHVAEGLSGMPKKLSSRYFYDDPGSKLFQQIMELPEYYLTRAEDEILREQSTDIFRLLPHKTHFNLIELGPGDGSKTQHLLSSLVAGDVDFTYHPIDISEQAIADLTSNFATSLPHLRIKPWVGDYFQIMDQAMSGNDPSVVLFLGSNIGNFEPETARRFLTRVSQLLSVRDRFLLGVDLKKHPAVVEKAYRDSQGVTAAFNLNLLRRINEELEADFDLNMFDFYSTYDPVSGSVRSYLVSLQNQDVRINAIQRTFHFEKFELISTELSRKYSLREVEDLARSSGFEAIHHFMDEQGFFADSLWRPLS